jgi:hypothetical protein
LPGNPSSGLRLLEEENKFQWEMNVVAVGCCVSVNEQINRDNEDIMRSVKTSAASQRLLKETMTGGIQRLPAVSELVG